MRELLKHMMDACPKCEKIVTENIALIREPGELLTEDQVEALLVYLSTLHETHV